ncbi:unnamed protein product, partial [Iphiclides podalirius]
MWTSRPRRIRAMRLRIARDGLLFATPHLCRVAGESRLYSVSDKGGISRTGDTCAAHVAGHAPLIDFLTLPMDVSAVRADCLLVLE